MRRTRRNPFLLNLAEKAVASAADWFFYLLNDYNHDETIRRDVRLSTAVALIAAVVSGDVPPSHSYNLPSSPLTPFSGTSFSDRDSFEITNFETGCIPKNEGHQALLRLTDSFKAAYVINNGTESSVIFDGVTGRWALFVIDQGYLCHIFSGVNFQTEDPNYMQDLMVKDILDDDYLKQIKPAEGNLITQDPAI